MTSTARTKLSVNVNKVAHLRNTRHLGIPSLTRAADICLRHGASGITVPPQGTLWRSASVPRASSSASTEISPLSALLT